MVSESARVEFLVEPFIMDSPGPHVAASVEVATQLGLSPDMGPFATTASGDLDAVIDAVGQVLRAGFDNGATSVQIRVDTGETHKPMGLHGAIERMVADVERDIGVSLADMDRAQKQRAVARLESLGAFLLRGSVEEVASLMAVSKVTLYAYLNAVTE